MCLGSLQPPAARICMETGHCALPCAAQEHGLVAKTMDQLQPCDRCLCLKPVEDFRTGPATWDSSCSVGQGHAWVSNASVRRCRPCRAACRRCRRLLPPAAAAPPLGSLRPLPQACRANARAVKRPRAEVGRRACLKALNGGRNDQLAC